MHGLEVKRVPTLAKIKKEAFRAGIEIEEMERTPGVHSVELWWAGELCLFATFHASLKEPAVRRALHGALAGMNTVARAKRSTRDQVEHRDQAEHDGFELLSDRHA